MRRMLWSVSVLIVSLAFGTTRADEIQGQFAVSLEITPRSTLPGIPVTFRIVFTNLTAVPAMLPPHGLIVATNDAGESFVVWPKPIHFRDFRATPVPAKESAVIELRPQGMFNDGTLFVEDLRLNRPGEFRFHVAAGKVTSGEGRFSIADDAIRSSDVPLYVIVPVGVDLDVWRELSKNRQGEWTRVWVPSPAGWALAARIVRQYPDSQYAGWIAASGVSEKAHESAEALRNWLNRSSADEYTEMRELRLALFDDTAARQWTQISHDEVLRHLRNARASLEKLKNSKNPRTASLARQRLEELGQVEESTRERAQ